MTAEVCLMNRLAIVIAADSASTVTQWTEKGSEERYFKGSNKIFQLSDHHPVGLMIFDSSDIFRVPWEIVVKAFRDELARKSFNSLPEYAAEFFSFLEKSPRLFPPEIQKAVFLDGARNAAFRVTIRADIPGEQPEARLAATDSLVAARRTELEAKPYPPNLEAPDVDQTLVLWKDDLIRAIEEWRDPFSASIPSDVPAFAELGMLEVFKDPGKQLGTTGLVFAGYGDHDIFPAFCEYKSCGIVAGKHVAVEGNKVAITHDMPAWLDSFAQTDMSDTFSMGISRGVYQSVMGTIYGGLNEFAKDVLGAISLEVEDVPAFTDLVKKSMDTIADTIMSEARREHAMPLRRVLGVLPVDQMADLAETLINLQSLKEKVTKNSETVGGPVDVAIITKNEGLIWVKRKHFFDIGLNSRFALRQQAKLA
jgi:hypothetical protein